MSTAAQGPWSNYAPASDDEERLPWEKYAQTQGAGLAQAKARAAQPTQFERSVAAHGYDPESLTGWRAGLQHAADVGNGVGEGMLQTVGGVSRAVHAIPLVGEKLAPSEGMTAMRQLATPKNTWQKIGVGGEQAGEFMAAPELEGATLFPRVGLEALKGGTSVAAHEAGEGSGRVSPLAVTAGTLTAGAVPAAGAAAERVAPALAESALRITPKMRGFGRTPGKAALEEIEGVRPGTVATNAQSKIADLTNELEERAANSETEGSTKPALDALDQEEKRALTRNNRAYYNQIQQVRDQLTKEIGGTEIPQNLPASRILDLKRGIGDLEKSWSPDQRGVASGLVRKIYRALDNELDRTVPGAKEINQRISSLVPVSRQAAKIGRSATLTQRLAGRAAAHTGALAGAGFGAYEGGKHGHPILGGLAGLAIPEIVAGPEGQMLAARGLARAGRWASRGGTQLAQEAETPALTIPARAREEISLLPANGGKLVMPEGGGQAPAMVSSARHAEAEAAARRMPAEWKQGEEDYLAGRMKQVARNPRASEEERAIAQSYENSPEGQAHTPRGLAAAARERARRIREANR